MNFLKPSKDPKGAIDKLSYPGQPERMKQYVPGFEKYFSLMPRIDTGTQKEVMFANETMGALADVLSTQAFVKHETPDGEFERFIIGIEDPEMGCLGIPGSSYVKKAGKELIVAKWGKGFTSPIHGHAPGYLNETVLNGKMRVTMYRLMDDDTVRVVRTIIATQGPLISLYAPKDEQDRHPRQKYIHSFVAIEPSASLHYLPEFNRDGRDNPRSRAYRNSS